MLSIRIVFLMFLFGVWMWASSIFTPWIASGNPYLWLYDLLFYTRFVLGFWAIIEFLLAWQQIKIRSSKRSSAAITIAVLSLSVLLVLANLFLMQTGLGFRLRVKMSEGVLAELRTPTFANQRQRAGWWLIDNQRQPCGNEAWLWLGQAYGGGTGNNMALVHSIHGVPKSPNDDAFRFLPLANGWWAAYQNPKQYFAHSDDVPVCGTGKTVNSHRAGLKFIGNE